MVRTVRMAPRGPSVWAALALCALVPIAPAKAAELLTKENVVDRASGGASWITASPGDTLAADDQVRTGELSRATIRLTDLSVLRVNELTTVRILPEQQLSGQKAGLDIKAGASYFFSRERPEDVLIRTPVATGALRGTEFHVAVAANGATKVSMYDGVVELRNQHGGVTIGSGEEGSVEPGSAPRKTAMIEARNIIQWCLYYPGIVNLDELGLGRSSTIAANESIQAYRAGDPLGALRVYARDARRSPGGELFRAAVLLAVGQVNKARAALQGTPAENPIRRSLEELIAAVTLEEYNRAGEPTTSSEWLSHSYYLQSRGQLEAALDAARKATAFAPDFGYAWTRVAELEFSFGRTRTALAALESGLVHTPRNAQAFALRGYLLSAQNKIAAAQAEFEHAMRLDGALGNAWLGRGLCFIRQGKEEAGRADIHTAATLEPNRSVFRSYLGKALSDSGYDSLAKAELKRAVEIDSQDPTPWLYSALQAKQEHRLNEAVRDLHRSLELNNNRRLYRSRFLLDQDRAVRSTNLAAIYQDVGMTDVSVREATRAVESDYANASAHRFLADSYNALRDPRRITLRYETPWANELLLYNLLSPVGGGSLSAYVSEQEYSKLFEADRLGVTSVTDYHSTGELREIASQYGTFGNFSYALDMEYLYDRTLGRPNSQTRNLEYTARVKLQLTPEDTVYLQVGGLDLRRGDVRQLYDQQSALRGLDLHEEQRPGVALLGVHHQWSPGLHTLFVGGRLADTFRIENPQQPALLLATDALGNVIAPGSATLDLTYRNSFTTYTAELNQIWDTTANSLIVGGRYQSGSFETDATLREIPFTGANSIFLDPAAAQSFETDLERTTLYVYDIFQPFSTVALTLGAAYDRLAYPDNYRQPPIAATEGSVSQFSPKAGLTLNPYRQLFIRAAYARALGGVSFDQSILIEPTQVAGFNQIFRSVLPESVVGSAVGAKFETYAVSVEDKLPTETFVGVQGTVIKSEVNRTIGAFETTAIAAGQNVVILRPFAPTTTAEQFSYTEQRLAATINQLLGEEWSLGARYDLSQVTLHRLLADIPVTVSPAAERSERALLHQLNLFALFNHPSGLFLRVDGAWYRQDNHGYGNPGRPGDDFWQFNAYAGCRLLRNRAELTLGFLNMTDRDYRLNPLNLYQDPPRERTVFARVRLAF